MTELATVYTDISFLPNGNLYGITLNEQLDLIDEGSGVGSMRTTFPGEGYVALTISATGEIFCMSFQGKVCSYRLTSGTLTDYRFSGLMVGNYRIRVRDGEGCVTFRRFE